MQGEPKSGSVGSSSDSEIDTGMTPVRAFGLEGAPCVGFAVPAAAAFAVAPDAATVALAALLPAVSVGVATDVWPSPPSTPSLGAVWGFGPILKR